MSKGTAIKKTTGISHVVVAKLVRNDKMNNPRPRFDRQHCRGLSLVELMISLAISAALLVATMVAVDISFRAYADAAQQASTQAATRMVTNRILTLIRTSTAHGPLEPDALAVPPVTLNGNVITSNFFELLAPNNDILRIEYRAADEELWLITTPAGGGADIPQPVLGGVTNAQFFASRRMNDEGLWVLDRATMDLSVLPDDDATFSIEQRNVNEQNQQTAIRMIASTSPRKIE